MKSIVLVITVITVAARSAGATEMVEVPSSPPYVPHEPSLLEKKNDAARGMLLGGILLTVSGLGLVVGGPFYLAGSCPSHECGLFGSQSYDFGGFGAMMLTGMMALGGGVTLTALGGSQLRKLHRPIAVGFTGTGVSLGGRF